MEKIIKSVSGFIVLVFALAGIGLGIYLMVNGTDPGGQPLFPFWIGLILVLLSAFFMKGLTIIGPNQAFLCTFFGKYAGTIKESGLLFVNPFFGRQRISLRKNNFESAKLKVNDKIGNPVEIAAVVVWQVSNTYKAAFEVTDYDQYVKTQSESAIRHLATTCPYDEMEDNNLNTITLRNGGEKVIEMLEQELSERLSEAGIVVNEARITHLAYAPEIAGDMLRRQQASAIVAARFKIVEGAVVWWNWHWKCYPKKRLYNWMKKRKRLWSAT